MKISYNWLKAYVPEIPEPNRLADIFTYHLCEVESVEKLPDGDFLFDLGILPNRAHDLLSHQGVARELSGLLGIEFKDPTPMYKTPASKPTNLKVEIETENCRRYSARIVRNIKVGPSPEWMVKHLESIGQRSINNIVDATNIVMYDCGQPTHAFDLQKIVYEKIKITNAKEGDELKLVGREGVTAKLKENDLVITSGGINFTLNLIPKNLSFFQ
jgi:phenylalanyl-tRNA synthetase beta chain